MRHPNTYQLRAFADHWYGIWYHCAPDQWLALADYIAGFVVYQVKEPTDEQIIEAIELLAQAGVDCPDRRSTWSGVSASYRAFACLPAQVGPV